MMIELCPHCNGKGFTFNKIKGYEEECIICDGTGKQEEE